MKSECDYGLQKGGSVLISVCQECICFSPEKKRVEILCACICG